MALELEGNYFSIALSAVALSQNDVDDIVLQSHV